MPNAIITGATQGIGKAIAEKLLANGFSIAICARTQEDLDNVKDDWSKKYTKTTILVHKADLADKGQVIDFANYVLAEFKTIDILVNNAGLFFPGKLMEEPDGHMEKLMEINLYSAYHLTRSVIDKISRSGNGHIFNICSVASLKAYPNGGSYGISKYALLGFSENLREEYKDENVKVTAICPGATFSRSWEGAQVANNRLMEANDVAEMLWSSYNLSAQANVETIVIRPTKGDL